MDELWNLTRGDGPLLINVPHAGMHIPAEVAAALTPAALAIPDTDWHVEKLYAPIAERLGATLMHATHSRFVVDLNRDPAGAALYPGASNTEICPTATFHEASVYLDACAPAEASVEARVARYWRPYHTALAAEIERVHARHGWCVLLDGHSIVSRAPRFFEGRLPDLNLGTADGTSCDRGLADRTFAILAAARGFSAVHNGRFKGGYITRHYGRPRHGVHALQLEMAQCCYMDESHPVPYDPERANALTEVLYSLAESLLAWRPPNEGQ